MLLHELRVKCAQLLINGNIRFDEENGTLSFDVSDEDREIFMEYVVNLILRDALNFLENK